MMMLPLIRILLLFAAVLSAVLSFSAPVRAGEWITDASASCALWNPNPQSGEFIRYKGSCKDGLAHGQGLVKWYAAGKLQSVYKGAYRGGKMHGHGVLVFPDGSRYEGTFLRGQRSGHGARTWPNGDFFEGSFANNRRHGPGVMDFANGLRFAGNYDSGKPHGTGDCYTPERGNWRCQWIEGKLQQQ